MARRLEMVFSNAAGRRSTVSVDNVREDVTQQEVQSAMNAILGRGIFTTGGGDLVAITGARIVATEITEIPIEG
jgi:elongation factor P hydroxylase